MSAQSGSHQAPPPPFSGKATDDKGPNLRTLVIILQVIMTAALALRFWSRYLSDPGNHGKRRFWWDDWLALFSWPTSMIAGALVLDMINFGLGKHVWTLSHADLAAQTKRMFATYILCDVGLALAKASCLLLYTRIFSHGQVFRWFQRLIWVSHMFNFGVWSGQMFYITMELTPQQQLEGMHGPDIRKYWLASAISSVFVDLILLLLPLPILWKVKIDLKRKLGVILMFILGYGTIVVSLGRLITITKAKDMSIDPTYEGITPLYWRASESGLTIVCVCLPAMVNLGRRFLRTTVPGVSAIFNTGKSLISKGSLHESKTSQTENDASALDRNTSTERIVMDPIKSDFSNPAIRVRTEFELRRD